MSNLRYPGFEEIEKSLMRPKSWWAATTILPLLKPFLYIYMRLTPLPAWVLTLFSFFCGVFSAWLFYTGHLIWGAVFFQFSFFLDCADGAVARLKNRTSEVWGYIDFILDRFKFFFMTLGITLYSFEILWGYTFLFLGFLYFLPWRFINRIKKAKEPSEYFRYPIDVEAQALAFFLFPLLKKITYGLITGSILLFLDFLLFSGYYFKLLKKREE